MTGTELTERLSADCEQPIDVVQDLLQALADRVGVELAKGQAVTLPGLGRLTPAVVRRNGGPVAVVTWSTGPELAATIAPLATAPEKAKTRGPLAPRRSGRCNRQ